MTLLEYETHCGVGTKPRLWTGLWTTAFVTRALPFIFDVGVFNKIIMTGSFSANHHMRECLLNDESCFIAYRTLNGKEAMKWKLVQSTKLEN